MDLKESVFWYMQMSEKIVENMKKIESDFGLDCTLGLLQQAVARVEVLTAIIDETGLNDEYHRWCNERRGQQ